MMPFMEKAQQFDIFNFNFGWEDQCWTTQRTAIQVQVNWLICPSDPGAELPSDSNVNSWTFASNCTYFYNSRGTVTSLWWTDGYFPYSRSRRLRDVTDGLTKTAMISERNTGSGPSGEALSPRRDYVAGPCAGLSGTYPPQFNNPEGGPPWPDQATNKLAAAAHYQAYRNYSPPANVPVNRFAGYGVWYAATQLNYSHLATPNSPLWDIEFLCTDMDDEECAAIIAPRSFHPGGVNVLYGDGSVSFVGDSIDANAWLAQGSINGNDNSQ
jgi:prepilin-type processing-associated H-X9-DG protein